MGEQARAARTFTRKQEDTRLSDLPIRIYYNEGHSGNNKYTFEVFKEPEGGIAPCRHAGTVGLI